MPSPRELEQLVLQVTDLVLAQTRPPAGERSATGRRLDLLLPLQTAHVDALVEQIGRLGRLGVQVTCRTSARVLAWLARTGRRERVGTKALALDEACLCESLGDYSPKDVVVLGSLGFGLVERLGRLADDDPFVRLCSQALLRGASVLAVIDDLRPGPADGRGPLGKPRDEALAVLDRLGVEPLPIGELSARVERLQAADSTLAQSVRGLLGEAEVEQLVAAGQRRLVLGRGTLVTPLARSRAQALGLELVAGQE